MKKRELKKKVLEISEGLLQSLTDLILVFINAGYQSFIDPSFGRSLPYTLAKFDQRMQKLNYLTIKRAIKYAMEKGWIKEDLLPTEEGQKRLKGFFLEYSLPPFWDGNWYIVNYDIPEKIAKKRDILRNNLIDLGFGKMQNSNFISPYNFLGDVEKVVKELDLEPYVILAISNKLGKESSKILAEKVWKISEIQKRYLEFIDEFEQKENPSYFEVFFKYHSILKDDPRLPNDLLPSDWPAKDAFHLYLKIIKKLQKSSIKSSIKYQYNST